MPVTQMKTSLNVDEGYFKLQWDSCLPWQKEKKNLHQLEINEKWAKGMNSASCNHFTSSNTFSLMDTFSVNPAGLVQQPSECKQSTLPQISSSPTVRLSIAHCHSRCNSRMSQLPAPASSPLLGGSAECLNYPRAGGWMALQHAQSADQQLKGLLMLRNISLKTPVSDHQTKQPLKG